MNTTTLAFVLGLSVMTAAAISTTPSFARHGADDPAGDDRGGKDDGVNHAMFQDGVILLQMARHGADDPAGDDRGGKRGRKGRGGHDDGPNHT